MAVNSVQDYYINSKALSFTPNYQGYKNIVYVSIVSNAAIKVFLSHVSGLGYGVDAQPQTWRLSGTTTALGTASAYFIYARLSRTKQTADIIFSVRDYTVEGGYSYTDSEGNAQTVEKSDEYFYIKIGSLTETDIAGEKATVNRVLTYASGELDTFKQRNEKSDSVFEQMFEFVSSGVEKLINVKQPFKSITVAGESLLKGLVTFVKGFVLGEKEITAIATSEDDYNEGVKDSTLPTTGYVQKELDALDDHFLIKDDADAEQSVSGPVTFEQDVAVQGDQSVGGNQDIEGSQTIGGNSEVDGSISAGKESSFKGGATFGEFLEAGGTIQGAHVDDRGFGKFAGLKSDYFEIFELIYNIQTARKGEEIFSDAATVESVEGLAMYDELIRGEYDDNDEFFKGECQLKLRSEREGYKHTFRKWDVIYGRVNNVGESGEYAQGGIFWGRVAFEPENEEDNLTLTVQIYADTETGSINISPTAHMVIARRGNKVDVTRQNTFYISTEEGNITQLLGVTKPLIDVTNTGAVLGLLPKHLRDYVESKGYTINAYAPYLYVRGLIAQDFMQLDYLGRPIRTDNYRGEWDADVAASDTEYYRMTTTTYDTVTYGGSLWECVVEKSNAEPPSEDNESWRLRVAKGEQGQSGDSKIYELKPNVNIIYLHDKDNASIDYISLVVGVTNTDGYAEITDSASLAERGLKVQYSYDGETSGRTDLTLPESVVFESEDGEYALSTEDESDMALDITIEDITKIEDNITFYLVDSEGNDVDTVVIPVVRDGIQGKPGPFPYPCGVWSNAVASLDDTPYVCTDESTVYVLWPNDEETGNFYVRTSNPMRYTTNADGTKTYYTPADDWAMGGLVGWRPMTKFQAINVSMLMADWARFGNSDGGVFYGHHLFSSRGLSDKGEDKPYTKDMFNSEGELNGIHVPHLFLDFKNGGAKFGKLSESFYDYFVGYSYNDGDSGTQTGTDQSLWTPIYYMNMRKSHNISHFPIMPCLNNETYLEYGDVNTHKPCVIVLPKANAGWSEDGTHVTILHKFDFTYSKQFVGNDIYRNSAMIVCADEEYFKKSNYYINENDTLCFGVGEERLDPKEINDGWIIWKGQRVKFVFLAPGTMLKLRSSISEGVITWFVENNSEFELMKNTCIVGYDDYENYANNTTGNNAGVKLFAVFEDVSGNPTDLPVIGSPQFNEFGKYEGSLWDTYWVIDASGGKYDEVSTCMNFVMFHNYNSGQVPI